MTFTTRKNMDGTVIIGSAIGTPEQMVTEYASQTGKRLSVIGSPWMHDGTLYLRGRLYA